MFKLFATAAFAALSLQTAFGLSPALASPQTDRAMAFAVLVLHEKNCTTPQSPLVKLGQQVICNTPNKYTGDQILEATGQVAKQVFAVGGFETWCPLIGDPLVEKFEEGFKRGMANGGR